MFNSKIPNNPPSIRMEATSTTSFLSKVSKVFGSFFGTKVESVTGAAAQKEIFKARNSSFLGMNWTLVHPKTGITFLGRLCGVQPEQAIEDSLRSLPVEGVDLSKKERTITEEQKLARKEVIDTAVSIENSDVVISNKAADIPLIGETLVRTAHNVMPLANPHAECYLNTSLHFARRMMLVLPLEERNTRLEKLPLFKRFIENTLEPTEDNCRKLTEEVDKALLAQGNKSHDPLEGDAAFFTDYAKVKKGISLDGGFVADVVERMFRGLGFKKEDAVKEYNTDLETQTNLHYQETILPLNIKAIADARAKRHLNEGIKMQDVINGDDEEGNTEAPKTQLIGKPPTILSFKFDRRKMQTEASAYCADYATTDGRNCKYAVNGLFDRVEVPFVEGNKKGIAIYEPIALTCGLIMKGIGGHAISFIKDGNAGNPSDWTFFSDEATQPFEQPDSNQKGAFQSYDPSLNLPVNELNKGIVPMDFCDLIGYRLVGTK